MEKCIQRGNIALFKRRLSETCDEAERVAIAKLLADEEAKGAAVRRRIGCSRRVVLVDSSHRAHLLPPHRAKGSRYLFR